MIGQAVAEPRAFELVIMLTLSRLIAQSALVREESRGTHFRTDFAQSSEAWRAHTLARPLHSGAHVRGVEIDCEPVLESAATR